MGLLYSATKRTGQILLAWILALPGPRLAAASLPATPGRPPVSVILISVDTLRADHLGCYGYKRLATPHFDAMAQGGTLFSAVNAQVPLTLPSHVSLLTSTLPFTNGVEDNGQRLGASAATLAKALQGHGYQTAAFVGAYVLDRRFGLNAGFDTYDSPFTLHGREGTETGEIKRFGGDVLRAAEQWIAQHDSAPFFVFVHVYDLHTPYTLPPGVRPPRSSLTYDDELSYVDTQLGAFWEFLLQRKILGKSLVVLTSDHGEGLGDHGETAHGYFVYQSTLAVPLICHWPEGSRTFPRQVDEPAGLLDVAPTILQFAGVPTPPEFQGRSLLGAVSGKPGGQKERIFSESVFGQRHFGVSALQSIREGPYKYVAAPRPELFDLAHDPGERRNLYDRQKSLALALRDDLLSLRARYHPAPAAAGGALDSETVEKLRSLGYMSVSQSHPSLADSGTDPKDRIQQYEQFARASGLASRGYLAQANALLTELLAKDPGIPDAHLSLGLNLQKMGRHAEAIANFQQVLKQDPANPLAHFDLAVSQFALHRLPEAEKECDVTLSLDPAYTRAEELWATVLLQERQFDSARQHLNHLLQVDPDNYSAHFNLGALAAMHGDWEEAQRQLRAALHADPASAEAHNAYGSLCLHRRDLACATSEFHEAIKLQPNAAPAHYNLGLVYRQQNREEDAEKEFRRALDFDPAFEPARKALAARPANP
jgi:arylsulfatase A-like enzyme/Tfp pilus assembly protein PilF